MNAEAEKALQKMKDYWIDHKARIVGINHPWKGETGTVKSIDYTHAGWGLKVDLENGFSTYVFKGTDIVKI